MRSSTSTLKPPKPLHLAKEAFRDTIKVVVGDEEEEYVLHTALLVHHSRFFRNALTGHWVESERKEVRLPDVEPWEFTLFAQWLVTGKIDEVDVVSGNGDEIEEDAWRHMEARVDHLTRFDASDRPKRVEEETESYHGITALSHVYVLADMLMCSTLKNLAIDTLIAFQSTRCLLPWPSIVRHVYEHTTDASKLRQLFVDLHVHEAASRYFDAESVYPTAHTNAMVRKFIDGKGSWFQMNQAPYHKRQICAMYHEHVEGEKKCGRWIHGCGRYEEEAP